MSTLDKLGPMQAHRTQLPCSGVLRRSAAAKRLAATAIESPETSLRVAGILSAVLGLVLIWLVRG